MILGGIALIIFIIGLCIMRPWARYSSDNKIHFSLSDFLQTILFTILSIVLIWFIAFLFHSGIEEYNFDNHNLEYFTETKTDVALITDNGVYFDVINGKYYINYYDERQIPLIYEVKSDGKSIYIHNDVHGEPPYVIIRTYNDLNWFSINMLMPPNNFTIYDVYLPTAKLLHVVGS